MERMGITLQDTPGWDGSFWTSLTQVRGDPAPKGAQVVPPIFQDQLHQELFHIPCWDVGSACAECRAGIWEQHWGCSGPGMPDSALLRGFTQQVLIYPVFFPSWNHVQYIFFIPSAASGDWAVIYRGKLFS